MAGSENIVQRILSEARESAKAMEAEAREKAQADSERHIKNAEQRAAEMREQNIADLAERERRILAVADLELRKRTLATKRQVLDEAYSQAEKKLAEMPDDQYVKAYMNIVAEALVKGTEGIAPSSADQNRLGAGFIGQLNARLNNEGKTADIKLMPVRTDIEGGCIVCDSGMEVSYSHAAVMRNLRENTEADVAHTLFDSSREG